MSQIWKYNDVELEFDMGDIDTQERYERAFDKMDEAEKKIPKTGRRSDISKAYCDLFCNLYDDLFGKGTGKKLLGENRNIRKAEESYNSFLTFVRIQVAEMNRVRSNMLGNRKKRKRK